MLFDTIAIKSSKKMENIINIRFRNTIPEIPSTSYGTFLIYKYPAKFIPQVVAYSLKTYAKKGMKIFDPFGGYGTVGLVSRIYGFDYEMWDLNPLLKHIHDTAIMAIPKFDIKEVIEFLKNSNKEFLPKWSNLTYWFPQEFLSLLSKTWGAVHSLSDEIKKIVIFPLLKVTRYFSFSDEKVHKLYCSKLSKEKVLSLLKKNWELEFYSLLEKEMTVLVKKIYEYNRLNPKQVNYKLKVGIDVLEEELEEEVNILITSPPYLQAQEYIRSTKLELFWLGYDEDYIKELSKKEIPYNPVNGIEIYSETYHKYRKNLEEPHLLILYDRYFHAILKTFTKLGEKVRNYMLIFVGPAKVRSIPIPIDIILIEHLSEFGWIHEVTYIDEIVSRVMFESRSKINPASKLEDHRIKTEHLIVLRKK